MKDSEIVKALKEILELMLCEGDLQRSATISNALDLINCQQAEIERLEIECEEQYESAEATIRAEIASGGTSCHWCEDKVRIEAYKECIEKVKEKSKKTEIVCSGALVTISYAISNKNLDNLLKELVDNNG